MKNLYRTNKQSFEIPPSLNPNRWTRKRMPNVLERLIDGNYLIPKEGGIKYNREKAKSPIELFKLANIVYYDLKYKKEFNRYRNGFDDYFSPLFVVSITSREFVPTDMLRNESMDKVYVYWEKLLSSIPLNAVPSSDIHKSFGLGQMTIQTYGRLRNLFPSLLPKNFSDCITYRCQMKSLFLLIKSNLWLAWNFLKKNKHFVRMWERASVEEKRDFVVFISASMLNGGFNDLRSAMDDVFGNKVRLGEIRNLREAIKVGKDVINWIKMIKNKGKLRIGEGNPTGTYALDVLKFFRYIHNLFIFEYMAIQDQVKPPIEPVIELEPPPKDYKKSLPVFRVVEEGELKTLRRRSKKTGNIYPCYVITLEGEEEYHNIKMLRAFLKNPTKENIKKILDFNGKKEPKGVMYIPKQFFNDRYGTKYSIILNNGWKTYRELARDLGVPENDLDTAVFYMYALNNSIPIRNLKEIRVPNSLLYVLGGEE